MRIKRVKVDESNLMIYIATMKDQFEAIKNHSALEIFIQYQLSDNRKVIQNGLQESKYVRAPVSCLRAGHRLQDSS